MYQIHFFPPICPSSSLNTTPSQPHILLNKKNNNNNQLDPISAVHVYIALGLDNHQYLPHLIP